MKLEIIEHNKLLDNKLYNKYKLEAIKLQNTENYITAYNIFKYTSVLLYFVILDTVLVGYVFIGKTDYGLHTLLFNLKALHSRSKYKNIIKSILVKYNAINKLLGIKNKIVIASLIPINDKGLINGHLEYGFRLITNLDSKLSPKLNLYILDIRKNKISTKKYSNKNNTKYSRITLKSNLKSNINSKSNSKIDSVLYKGLEYNDNNITEIIEPNSLKGYENCYILSANKLNSLIFTFLQSELENYGFIETKDPKRQPLLLWVEILENYKFDTKYFQTKCWINNVLSDTKTYISNKANLYYNFCKHFPKQCLNYMSQTWNFKINPQQFLTRVINSNEVFIVRPAGTGAFSGKGIVIIHDQQTFNEAIKTSKSYEKVIISKYVNDPLLFNGRKFHLRPYLLIGVVNGKYMTKFLDFYQLYTALKPYKNSDYGNPDIHDSHFRSTPQDYICPQDLPEELKARFNNDIYPNMRECMLLVSKMFAGHAKPYPEAKNAFEVFGCDFLVRDNNEVVLLEINDRINLKKYTVAKRIELSKLILDDIYKGFILPTLNPDFKTPDNFWLYTQ
jgi:hypothetical protein